jgi:glutamate racemase
MQNPVGVFDSGLGGLTAVRAIQKLMPEQDIIYLGDTARVPYGVRSPEVITKYALANAHLLFSRGIKALVVACGTVSATALDALKEISPVPVLGVVEPTCAAAVKATENGRVGLIGTAATVSSRAYERGIAALNDKIEVFSTACPLFVPLVENGRFKRGDTVAETVTAEYLQPLRQKKIDTLLLGCTHYPLLHEIIFDFMGDVSLIDAGKSVAASLAELFPPEDRQKSGSVRYLVTDGVDTFSRHAEMFLQNPTKGLVERVDIEGI